MAMADENHLKRLSLVQERLLKAAQDELENGDISAMELLGVLAYSTGACIAMQDMTEITPKAAMEIVIRNIEIGNLETIKRWPRPQG